MLSLSRYLTENNNLMTCSSHIMVYSNTTVFGENGYGKSGHMYIFTSLKHVMMLLKCNFGRASFLHHITDTDSM